MISESLEGARVQMVYSNPKFGTGNNFRYFCQNAKQIFGFNTSSERPLPKLSENHKINVIGSTELKLWTFKDALSNAK